MGKVDVTAVVTGHNEGRLAVPTLRSFFRAISFARAEGLTVQAMMVLDNADELTTQIFQDLADEGTVLMETQFGDQGKARNQAVDQAEGDYISFLDGDDLWTEDWLVRAYQLVEEAGGDNIVLHPEFNYFFEGQATIFRHIDQHTEEFDLDQLRLSNYWDALSFCKRDILKKFRYCDRDVANGWAYEDWHWNIITVQAGIEHRVLPDSVIFKRRRKQSQTLIASKSKTRVRSAALFDYSNEIYS